MLRLILAFVLVLALGSSASACGRGCGNSRPKPLREFVARVYHALVPTPAAASGSCSGSGSSYTPIREIRSATREVLPTAVGGGTNYGTIFGGNCVNGNCPK